jgi:hypothetical protein
MKADENAVLQESHTVFWGGILRAVSSGLSLLEHAPYLYSAEQDPPRQFCFKSLIASILQVVVIEAMAVSPR